MKRGVRRVTAWIEQRGSRIQVFQKTSPGHWWRWPRNQPPTHVTFDAGKEEVPALKEGKALLIVEAVGDDFRGDTAKSTYDVRVALDAPAGNQSH